MWRKTLMGFHGAVLVVQIQVQSSLEEEGGNLTLAWTAWLLHNPVC